MDHSNPSRWWRLPAAGLAAVALATSSIPAYADADRQPGLDSPPTASTAAPAPVSPDLVDQRPGAGSEVRAAADDASSVTDYWTAERMAGAIPADDPDRAHTGEESSTLSSSAAADSSPEPSGAPTVIAEPVAPADAAVADAAAIDTPAADDPTGSQAYPVADSSDTNGKVFFRDQRDGRDYMCSGSAVGSATKRLVITAGHCVHGGPGGTWHANWVFAPGYDHGPGPEGTFPATSFRALDEWIAYGASGRGFNSDVAFVTTETNDSGETVVDAVGGHGLATGGSPEFEATLFGYPGNLDAGERMWTCRGTTDAQQVDTFVFPTISGCGFGPGSSGGPWLDRYDDAAGLGYVRSVTSFGPASGNEYISGPQFDQRVSALYDAADGDGRGED
jgi:V8-like Glu-specific endopeptidase